MKTYKDAAVKNFNESILGPKIISITVILIFAGLISCFKIVFPSLKSSFSLVSSLIAIVLLAITGTIIFFCYLFLTRWIYKIETNNEHLTTHSIIKKNIYQWSEIGSIELEQSLGDKKTARVITNSGHFTFTLTMKNINEEYPKYSQDFKYGNCWIDEKYKSKPITPENCELFQAIKEKTTT